MCIQSSSNLDLMIKATEIWDWLLYTEAFLQHLLPMNKSFAYFKIYFYSLLLIEADHWDWKINERMQLASWKITRSLMFNSAPSPSRLSVEEAGSGQRIESIFMDTQGSNAEPSGSCSKQLISAVLLAWLSFQGESSQLSCVRTDFTILWRCGYWCGDGNASSRSG